MMVVTAKVKNTILESFAPSNKFADIYNDEQLIIFLDQNEEKIMQNII